MSVPETSWLDADDERPLAGPALWSDDSSDDSAGSLSPAVPPEITVARMGLWGHLSGAFYPRLVFGDDSTINFEDPCNTLTVEAAEIGVQNMSLAGLIEGLSVRVDYRLTLTFQTLSYGLINNVWDWWATWARFSKPTAITLDRFDTCSGQWEYDRFNSYFSRAICLTRLKAPRRLTPGKQLFVCQLQFQQVPEDA